VNAHHKLLLLPQPFLAQKHDGRFEDETHRVQFKTLLNLAEEIGNIEPFDTAVVQKVTWA